MASYLRGRLSVARCLLGALLLSLAGCVTPYQARSLTGGYQERQLSADRWYVEFFGNGNTQRDTVMVFWLNRCAELTVAKGYDYFIMISKEPRPAAANDGGVYRARGGGAPTYVYVPGGTVTTWSAHGTIEMHRGDADTSQPRTFVARELMSKLAPLMREAASTGKNVKLPDDFLAKTEEGSAPSSGGAEPVKLEDLQGLLPPQK